MSGQPLQRPHDNSQAVSTTELISHLLGEDDFLDRHRLCSEAFSPSVASIIELMILEAPASGVGIDA